MLILPLESVCGTVFFPFHTVFKPQVVFERIYTFPMARIFAEFANCASPGALKSFRNRSVLYFEVSKEFGTFSPASRVAFSTCLNCLRAEAGRFFFEVMHGWSHALAAPCKHSFQINVLLVPQNRIWSVKSHFHDILSVILCWWKS